jgi:peptidyl-prolyl cis-trans isomerase C
MNIARLIFLSAMALLSGCADEPPAQAQDALGPGQVATVDGKRIPESMFRIYVLNALQRNADDLSAEERARAIEDLVYVLVLSNEGEERGIPAERAMAAELELIRWQSIAREVTERFREQNPPSEAEIRALYEENLPRLSARQYHARHILVATEDEAATLITQIDDGGDFAALANEHSTDGDGKSGGDLGWFTAETMVQPFGEAIRTMEDGTYTRTPVQTQYGWHVIKVEESREGQAPDIESLRTELTSAVERRKLDEYIRGLREGAVVDLDAEPNN